MPLPQIIYEDFIPTRDYLRDIAVVLEALQQALAPSGSTAGKLRIGMRGLLTHPYQNQGQTVYATLDLVRNMVRVPGSPAWSLEEYAAPEIRNNIRLLLERQQQQITLAKPAFRGGRFEAGQAKAFAEAMWWAELVFRRQAQSMGKAEVVVYAEDLTMAVIQNGQPVLAFVPGDASQPDLYCKYAGPTGEAIITYQTLQQAADPTAAFEAFMAERLY